MDQYWKVGSRPVNFCKVLRDRAAEESCRLASRLGIFGAKTIHTYLLLDRQLTALEIPFIRDVSETSIER